MGGLIICEGIPVLLAIDTMHNDYTICLKFNFFFIAEDQKSSIRFKCVQSIPFDIFVTQI